MNIEIVEFYPMENKHNKYKLIGTLHIYLVDYGIHIRGVFAAVAKNGAIFFNMPGGYGIDQETGQKVRYPYLGFTDAEKYKDLMQEIREKGKKYIEENYLSNLVITH